MAITSASRKFVGSLCKHCLSKARSGFSGKEIYIPKRGQIVDPQNVRDLRRRGASVSDLAERFDVTTSRIYQLLRRPDTRGC